MLYRNVLRASISRETQNFAPLIRREIRVLFILAIRNHREMRFASFIATVNTGRSPTTTAMCRYLRRIFMPRPDFYISKIAHLFHSIINSVKSSGEKI